MVCLNRWKRGLLLACGALSCVAAQGLEFPEVLEPVAVASGYTSLEGPVWSDHEHCLYFSNQERPFGLHRYVPGEGASVVEAYSNKVNGNLVLPDGSLVTCESGNRRIVRRDRDGNLTVLVDNFEGAPLNEPNDLVRKSDGTLWFTTPTWSNPDHGQYVYVLDPATGALRRELGGLIQPNGLAFSPDESWFYLMHFGGNRILRFPVEGNGTLGEAETLVAHLGGGPDGMVVDVHGNLYACVYNARHPDGGVTVFSPEGERLRHIPVPGTTTNAAFGGPHRQQLYITSGDALYMVDLADVYPIERPELEIECEPGEVRLSWRGTPGQRYWIERSADLQSWERLDEPVDAKDDGVLVRVLSNNGDCYFRLHPVWNH